MSTDNKKLKSCPKFTEVSVNEKGHIHLSWTEVPSADKYAIKRDEKYNGSFDAIAWRQCTDYTDESIKEDVTYWYRIVALKILKKKKNSKKSSPIVAIVKSSIPAPQEFKAVSGNGSIHLQWKAPQGVSSFLVYRRNDYFNQLIPIKTVNGTEYTDKDVVQGQIYYYSVQSLIGKRQGNFGSEEISVSLDCGELIGYKARLFKRVDLQARIVAGADGYIFERSEDGESFTEIAKTDSDVALRYTDKTEKAFTEYFYRVRAYKKVGETVYISEPSRSVKIKTK